MQDDVTPDNEKRIVLHGPGSRSACQCHTGKARVTFLVAFLRLWSHMAEISSVVRIFVTCAAVVKSRERENVAPVTATCGRTNCIRIAHTTVDSRHFVSRDTWLTVCSARVCVKACHSRTSRYSENL